jgi:hypothetical protein
MVGLLLKVLGSGVAKSLIANSLKYLIEHKTDGVTKDVALNMVDAIAQSKANTTSYETFKGVVNELTRR